MIETILTVGFVSLSIIASIGIGAYAYIKKAGIIAGTEQLWIKTDGEIQILKIKSGKN